MADNNNGNSMNKSLMSKDLKLSLLKQNPKIQEIMKKYKRGNSSNKIQLNKSWNQIQLPEIIKLDRLREKKENKITEKNNNEYNIGDNKDKNHGISASNDNIKKFVNFNRSYTKPLKSQLSKLNSSVVKDSEQSQYLETDLNIENTSEISNKVVKNILSNHVSSSKMNLFQSPVISRNVLNFKDNKTTPNVFLMSFQKKSDLHYQIKPLINLNKSQIQEKHNQSSEKVKLNLTNIIEDKAKFILKDRKLKIKLNKNVKSNGFYNFEFSKFSDPSYKELNKSSIDFTKKEKGNVEITKKVSSDFSHSETHQQNSFHSTNSNENITLQKLKSNIVSKTSDSIIRKTISLKENTNAEIENLNANNKLIFNKNSVCFDSNLLVDVNHQSKGKLSSDKLPQSQSKTKLTPEEGIEDIHFEFVKFIKKSKNIAKLHEIKSINKPGLEYTTVVEYGEINIDDNFN